MDPGKKMFLGTSSGEQEGFGSRLVASFSRFEQRTLSAGSALLPHVLAVHRSLRAYVTHILVFSSAGIRAIRIDSLYIAISVHRSLRAYVTHILVFSSAGIRAIRRDSLYIAISVCNETIHYTICQISRLAGGESNQT
jgi:hypothetical protein